MPKVNYQDSSRLNWTTNVEDENGFPGLDRLQVGCLMRIADATEAMAKNNQDLISENESLRRRVKHLEAEVGSLKRDNRILRNHLTRTKNKLAKQVSHERTT